MNSTEWTVALTAVGQACRLTRYVQERIPQVESMAKEDRSPVTVADYAVQAVVAYVLAQAFSDDLLMAEEEAATLRRNEPLWAQVQQVVQQVLPELSPARLLDVIDRGGHGGGASSRFWVLDPVDGTKGFLRREQFAIALALIENGRPVLGVLGCPQLPLGGVGSDTPRGVLLAAADGRPPVAVGLTDGVERPLAVSTQVDPRRLVFCESVESAHSSHDSATRVAAELGVQAPSLRVDSQVKYGLVARGEADVYLRLPTRADYAEKVWDHAAGCLIVQAAGGQVTDVHGAELDFTHGRRLEHNEGVVATNGHLHEAVLAAVERVRK